MKLIFLTLLSAGISASAQDSGMDLMNMASGTSQNPRSWTMPMAMRSLGGWRLMFMGQAWLMSTQQSGPRGGDKVYAPNWFMGSAQHSFAGGTLMFQTMLSLDPATITNRSYPLLFQTGETAYGRPLTDAQHPHDFIMSLGVQYARPVADKTTLQLYYAPVGDPALGPVAFPHRASAFELPQATLGHHWQDATHIAANVATVGIERGWLRVEASGFHGTEPDENRWNVDWGGMNSYSGRVSVTPSKNWLAQVSAGRIEKPERQEDGDVVRTTASLHYTRPMSRGNGWSSSLIWGRNHSTATKRDLDSYLVESLFPVTSNNFITGRVEVVDKDELEHPGVFRIHAYTVGYTRDIGVFKGVETGIGANLTAYAIPSSLQSDYGVHPWGTNVYLRFRLNPGKEDDGGMHMSNAPAQSFSGVVTDTMCKREHTMYAGMSDADCIAKCLKGSSQYALYDGNSILRLSGQSMPAKFAAKRVKITGTLDQKTRTIRVAAIEPEVR